MPADEKNTAPPRAPNSFPDTASAGTLVTPSGNAAAARSTAAHRPFWRRIVTGLIVIALAGIGLNYAIPWMISYFNHVSTDDAYIAGYVTYLGPRIASRVDQVTVNEDDFIQAGQVLIRLDPKPFQLAIEESKANLQLAQANLVQSRAEVRSQISTARANQYLAQSAVDQVHYQVASLKSAVADLKLADAQRVLAEKNLARDAGIVGTGVSQKQYDQDQAALNVARDRVASQEENVQRNRAGLGLPRNLQNPVEVPPDIESRYPQVQTALSNWATLLIQIGIPLKLPAPGPESFSRELNQWMADRITAETVDSIVENAPAVQVARAKVHQAQAALDQARLNLSYTEILAPFDGFVTKRSVNPGDYATPGQNLLVVQSLRDVWVDANFKETAIDDLRIGLPVSVYVDAYPGKVFSGRVAGFSAATGSRLSLLPPENATGNFVKVVQRLPVRIEFDEPPSPETPLFVGLSVEPEVEYKSPPRGPHAGMRLKLPPPGRWPEPAGKSAEHSSPADRNHALPNIESSEPSREHRP